MIARRILIAFAQLGLTVLALVVVFLLYAGITTHNASSKADALCGSMRIGQDADLALASLQQADGDSVSGNISSGHVAVNYKGAFVEEWTCFVSFADGKVAKAETVHLD